MVKTNKKSRKYENNQKTIDNLIDNTFISKHNLSLKTLYNSQKGLFTKKILARGISLVPMTINELPRISVTSRPTFDKSI
jgi:hypothetical protein